MALKMDLKGIFILEIYNNLMQIATWNANSEQSMNGYLIVRRGSRTVLEVF